MATGNDAFPSMAPISGVRLGTACAGIKKADRKDVLVIEMASSSTAAAVFTQNAFCAAPVIVARQHLAKTQPRYLLINSGNANAGTGDAGIADALFTCGFLAAKAGVASQTVLPFSTGVIGEFLPVDKVNAGSEAALANLSGDGWSDAAHAIMTTDTRPKGCSVHFEYGGERRSITGIAKGAGMIRPDMATMLSFIATDAKVPAELLDQALSDAVKRSFNRITIDGDTSTNDAVVLIATGQSGDETVDPATGKLPEVFSNALNEVCTALAQGIIRDGEGATKFVTVTIAGGESEQECLRVGYAIAHSPLVKTALFASDPNWGRILAAVGRAGVKGLDVSAINIFLDDVCIVERGAVCSTYTEARGQQVMEQEDIRIRVELNRGCAEETLWTTDLSHDYVSINADYRT